MIANIGDIWIVALIAIVVLVGGSQLPKIARNVGLAGKEFRNAQDEAEAEKKRAEETKAVNPAPAPVQQPYQQPVQQAQPVQPVQQAYAPPASTPAPAPAPAPAATPAPAPVDPAVTQGDDKVTISRAELEKLLDERLGKGSADN